LSPNVPWPPVTPPTFRPSAGEQTIAGGLDNAAVVLGDFRIHQFAVERLEAPQRPLLVGPIKRE
jgi:hypothetical protein